MSFISIVIITKNEEANIVACIQSAKKISEDIIVIDSGSTDKTILLAKNEQVKVVSIQWNGYGNARNTGSRLASHNWILSLDADERITEELAHSIAATKLTNEKIIYGFKRQNYFENRIIRFGAHAHDQVYRLYNRNYAQWDAAPVHEKIIGENVKKCLLKSYVKHYSISQEPHYIQKLDDYALLCALKYRKEKRNFITIRCFLSPGFNFLKEYIFQLGFLDGRNGFLIAKLNAFYTSQKYHYLHRLLCEDTILQQQEDLLQAAVRKIISFLM